MGFSEFQVGKDHPDYIMSQHRYMRLAMKKPRFSHLRKILKKKGNQEPQSRTNITTVVNSNKKTKQQYDGDEPQEPLADD